MHPGTDAEPDDPPKQIRVLVVDDNVDAADGLAEVLCLANYVARAAYDGKDALKIVPIFRPHVVLLDIDMPHMDGYATAARLRRMLSQPPPVLIAHTANSDPTSVAASVKAGFDLHVSKPCEVRHLLQLLKRTVNMMFGGRSGSGPRIRGGWTTG